MFVHDLRAKKIPKQIRIGPTLVHVCIDLVREMGGGSPI